jgi:flagellar basal-body rod modification protein FlgD
MSQNMELSRYSSFVGKEVVIASEGSDGKTTETRGFVDYVTFEGGKAYFSIEGNLYAASDMVTAISSEYSNAEEIAKDFAKTIKDLPSVDSITIKDNGNTINNLLNAYDSLNSYQKGFLDDGDVESMNKYVDKLNQLLAVAAAEAAKKAAVAESEVTGEAEEAGEAEEGARAVSDATGEDGSSAEEMAETAAAEGLVTPEEDKEN